MGIVKAVLKRPVTMVLVVVCLMVFGLSSVFTSKIELTPEMSFPMMIVSTIYPGASPENVNDLVSKPLEENIGALSGIKNIYSVSRENISLLILEYQYGTNMDKAYSDLRKKMDSISLPENVEKPGVMELNINEAPTITLALMDPAQENLYNFVNAKVSGEFEKISSIASVKLSGGQEEYISVRLIPEKMNQHRLSMQSVIQGVKGADFAYPAGSTGVGKRELSVSTAVEIKSLEDLKRIPLMTADGKMIYLEDVAQVSEDAKKKEAIGRFNGEDTIIMSINKQQKDSAVDVTKGVEKVIEELKQKYPTLDVVVIDDASDQILSTLNNIIETMVAAVIVSMIVIFLFFGDWKASLIVGSSMPISMLASLIMMTAMGFSVNLITMSSIILAIGNMTDDSIVVLDSCFRAQKGSSFKDYMEGAAKGTGEVFAAILGGAITNSIVFVPLVFIEGMSGQLFKPLAFTLIFSSLSSAISGLTIVPMCYTRIRPREKHNSPIGGIIRTLQEGYSRLVSKLIRRKALTMSISIILLIFSFIMAAGLGFELMPEMDEGTIKITIGLKPGIKVEEANKVMAKAEEIVVAEEDLDSYMLTYGGGGLSMESGDAATLNAYLKDDRILSTNQIMNKWKKEMQLIVDADIKIESTSSITSFSSGSDFEVILQSAQLDELKTTADRIITELRGHPELIKVHSDLENAASVISVRIDPVKAAAAGVVPINVGAVLNNTLSGVEAATLERLGENTDIVVEYPRDAYDSLNKVEAMLVPNQMGSPIALADIGDIVFEDSPSSIMRKNKQYLVTITGSFTEMLKTDKEKSSYVEEINQLIENNYLTTTVTRAESSEDEMMMDEFINLATAIVTAVFLLFVVMAIQFESVKFSLMVMTAIPFSLIGAFGLMVLAGIKINMPSLMGFLMLIGAVVKSGILYVETADAYGHEMDKDTAVVQAGVSRFRSILMTTLIAIVSIVPMALGLSEDTKLMQGLSLVNVGGLTASTILTLLLLPVYYSIMTGGKERREP